MLEFPEMSYTAITGNREMAGSFSRYLLAAASKMVPRQWSVQDLNDVLNFVLEGGDTPVQFIEGRYLRKRIREQIARAERYKEPFALMVLALSDGTKVDENESLVDLLTERLRRSDMVFLYRHRIAVLLPHTPFGVLAKLEERIAKLADATLGLKEIGFAVAAFPDEKFESPERVLDWIEDQLR
ncbi:MAG: hypothetical protein JRG91_09260 [Deltaproteobacteria bacterium]|nr:hypothetical protein [Deltaproteobacteria bacterium]